MKHVMILEHEDGRTRYFGPVEDLDRALKVAEAYFGYDLTPYTVSFTPLTEPLGSEFLEAKTKDGES